MMLLVLASFCNFVILPKCVFIMLNYFKVMGPTWHYAQVPQTECVPIAQEAPLQDAHFPFPVLSLYSAHVPFLLHGAQWSEITASLCGLLRDRRLLWPTLVFPLPDFCLLLNQGFINISGIHEWISKWMNSWIDWTVNGHNQRQFHGEWNLCDILEDGYYMAWRQKVCGHAWKWDQHKQKAGVTLGRRLTIKKTFWGDETVLCLNYSGSYMNPNVLTFIKCTSKEKVYFTVW